MWWLWIGLMACGSEAVDTAPIAPGEDDPRPDDVALLDAAIAGEVTSAEALHAVAWSGGLPAQVDAGTWRFVTDLPGDRWAIAGDFSDWAPLPMHQGEGLWWVDVAIEAPQGARYKLTDGATWQADPWARAYEYDEHGAISFVVPPLDRGRIERWPDVHHDTLATRDLRVWVPPEDGPWPVVYVQDGQNLFDPGAMWGGWRLHDAAAALSTPILVVGIDATADRLAEYAHVDDVIGGTTVRAQGAEYVALLHDTIVPHVDAHYPTRRPRAVMGASMGGLAALHAAHLHPDAFDLAASLSGTLGWGTFGMENPTLQALYEAAGVRAPVLYVDSGGTAADCTDNYCTTRAFADAMAAVGYTWDEALFHWHEPGATHDEAAWRARADRPLGLIEDLAAR